MLLPNPTRAVVDAAKVRDYLLSAEHRFGRFKAIVFEALGYHRESWQVLQADLAAVAALPGAELKGTSRYGQKFELPANLIGPAQRELFIVTVWLAAGERTFRDSLQRIPEGEDELQGA
jgi:5,10-methenyltetrahydromethanopterin hydrogenase